MTLRSKTLLTNVCGVLLAVVVLWMVASSLILDGFEELERQNTRENAQRAANALQREIDDIHTKAVDWANWDDCYQFVQDRNEAFIASNLEDATLLNMELNVMCFLKIDGQSVFERWVDLASGDGVEPPASFQAQLVPSQPLLQDLSLEDGRHGILLLDEGLLLFSVRPVVRTDGSGPVVGTLLMGRWLDELKITQLEEITQFSLDMWSVRDTGTPADVYAAFTDPPADTDDPASVSYSTGAVGRPTVLDKDRIAGYFSIAGLDGLPAVNGRIVSERIIYAQGVRTLRYFLGAFVLISFGFTWLAQRLLDILVLRRLRSLRDDVRRIGESGDLCRLVTVKGRDELADVALDINAMVKALDESRQALQIAKEMAEAATRIKSEFLANMSHEIRTPMTAILGFADLLADPSESESDRASYAQTVRRNGEHLLNLINDILDLSKIEAGKMNHERIPCSVIELLSGVQTTMSPRARTKGLNLWIEASCPLPATILTDPTRLHQILINLVGNAVKFTHVGGVRIVVGLTTHPQIGRDMLRFDVTDSGIGLSPEQMAGLFQAFSQADSSHTRRFGGTGLGLAICRRLAEMLGGGISVESQVNAGSTFTVTIDPGPLDAVERIALPASMMDESDAEGISAPSGDSGPDPVAARGRILLTEDKADTRVLVSTMLRRDGYHVTLAQNGRESLQKAIAAQRAATPFDVILMDMQMPVLNGYETVTTLRSMGYTLPIVALTALTMKGDRDRCLAAGCDDYAPKPVDRQALLDLIARYVAKARDGTTVPQSSRTG